MPASKDHIATPEIARRWPHLKGVSDHLLPLMDAEVGLLIGFNCAKALAPVEVVTHSGNGPFAQKTVLGWGVVGIVSLKLSYSDDDICSGSIGVSHRLLTLPEKLSDGEKKISFVVKNKVKEIFNIEGIEAKGDSEEKGQSLFDKCFLRTLEEGIHKFEDGIHFEMPLPFKSGRPNMPNNRSQARLRLELLRRRFEKNIKFKEDYCNFMNGIMNNEYAERVHKENLDDLKEGIWYIPHHGVYHPKKPTKIRVVFDCAANYLGKCLNDELLSGPDFINSLFGILCRFRKEHVAFVCDIEQMFFQFKVNREHRDYLRFLWWPDSDCSKPPADFRMNVHLFGAASSPGCAMFGLRQLARDSEAEFGSSVKDFLLNNFYVDDGLASLPSVSDAKELISKSIQACQKGGLKLHKFSSSRSEVLQSVNKSSRASDIQEKTWVEEIHTPRIERVLGVQWCIESDEFRFRIVLSEKPYTRRGILSTVNSVYDPLGFIAPVVLIGKRILQELCRSNYEWDAPLPDNLRPTWENWRDSLPLLANLKIPRCYKPEDFGKVKSATLHHFSDASEKGYGQCTYLRLVNSEDRVHCSLVCAKSRVAPTKVLTIPRLELAAATVSVKISCDLSKELDYQNMSHVFWTDSKVVLGYIANESRRFKVFVANRVQFIQNHSDVKQWKYVSSSDNPADRASRGLLASDFLEDTLWFSGPEFLWLRDPGIDSVSEIRIVEDDDTELRSKSTLLATSTKNTLEFDLSRFRHVSSWERLLRIIALCPKFIQKLRVRAKLTSDKQVDPHLSVSDIQAAERVILKLVQRCSFKDEIQLLQRLKSVPKSRSNGTNHCRLRMSSKLYRLDPYIDDCGILRVGGRLENCTIGVRHPVILPRRHYITALFVRYQHEKGGHQGRGMTTNMIRASGFWIIGCSAVVSQEILRCVLCRRARGSVEEQKMANLPTDRLEPSPPFTYCAVDYFGPFLVKEGRKLMKRYGVLFTCMASRAIHVEVANSLSTDRFINTLRRFIAVRGPIRQLRSDQGTNFVGARTELQKCITEMNTQKIEDFLLKNRCDLINFKMNVPASSHMGGVWERQIKTVRSVLNSLIKPAASQLDDDALRTLMCEVMAIVNCRPLSTDTLNDPLSLQPLTPNHLLTAKSSIVLPPPGEFQREDLYLRKYWRRVQYLANVFWSRWRKEFLSHLQIRQKWCNSKRNLCVGDVVLLKDENLPRNQWSLARVQAVHNRQDGYVRTVRIALAYKGLDSNGRRSGSLTILERPVQKLVLLVPNSDLDA